MYQMENKDFLWLADKLTNAKYRFAKSMPRNPHWYTLRETWKDDEFVKAVTLLRAYGYEYNWYGHWYTCFDVNDYYYWTMGEPINLDGKPHTILINTKKRNMKNAYDLIASEYDSLFETDEFIKEDYAIIELTGYKKGMKVLDVGCGTGMFIDRTEIRPEDYLGIDPSEKMLEIFGKKHPEHKTINTEWETFYSNEKYDIIVALYGVGSYILKDTIDRMKHFLNDNGKAFIMFYKEGYSPYTYAQTGVYVNNCKTFAKEVSEEYKTIGNYDIVEIRK